MRDSKTEQREPRKAEQEGGAEREGKSRPT